MARPVCERIGIRHATASQLIREERGSSSWSTTKEVTEIEENQRALIRAVRRLNANHQELLLDGHFVLRGKHGKHEALSVEVFTALQCTAVILLTAPATVLKERLTARGDNSWTIDDLERLSNDEFQQSHFVASELFIPLTVLDMPDQHLFEETLESEIRRSNTNSNSRD
ncbi:AAA family ATPase [Ralstonia mannitolilytica]|nr:AAA family ATPase [Ralstonia mannitolilytica]